MNRRAQVSIVRTEDRATGIASAIGLLGSLAPRFANRTVVIKPNFNSGDAFPGSTHPDTVRALAAWLRQANAAGVSIAERSGGSWVTLEVLEEKGMPALAKELAIQLIATDSLPAEEWIALPLDGTHWSRGVEAPRVLLEAEAILQTCCLKTHAFGGHFTMSLKNVIGVIAKESPHDGYAFMKELHGSPHMREMIAEANLIYRPDLVVLDGIHAFVRGGPATGDLEHPGVIMASEDRVAIDAVGVAILRMYDTTADVRTGPVFELEQIRRAAELGLGVASPAQIDLIAAPDADSRAFAGRIREILNCTA